MSAFTELGLNFSAKIAVPTSTVAKIPPTWICDVIEKALRDYFEGNAIMADPRIDIFVPQPGVQPGGIEIHPAE